MRDIESALLVPKVYSVHCSKLTQVRNTINNAQWAGFWKYSHLLTEAHFSLYLLVTYCHLKM